MKQFFERTAYWKVLIVLLIVFITTLTVFFMVITPHTMSICVKLGGAIGGIVSLLALSFIFLTRKSIEFWDYAGEVKELIKSAKTKDELEKIYKNQFQILIKKSMGSPHIVELTKLHTIMTTKYDYL